MFLLLIMAEIILSTKRTHFQVHLRRDGILIKWWYEQPQDKVHTLVEEGRLKYTSGAWSMNDEASTYYQSTIDQFTFRLE
jgi:hypothetical protein